MNDNLFESDYAGCLFWQISPLASLGRNDGEYWRWFFGHYDRIAIIVLVRGLLLSCACLVGWGVGLGRGGLLRGYRFRHVLVLVLFLGRLRGRLILPGNSGLVLLVFGFWAS